MGDSENEVPESPATWENVVVGKAIEMVGRVTGNEKMTEEGEDQEETAHEVREEFAEEQGEH
jgi:uncharacterized protein YjbJ (UPF0337 family)